jgi:hypothetical protein
MVVSRSCSGQSKLCCKDEQPEVYQSTNGLVNRHTSVGDVSVELTVGDSRSMLYRESLATASLIRANKASHTRLTFCTITSRTTTTTVNNINKPSGSWST